MYPRRDLWSEDADGNPPLTATARPINGNTSRPGGNRVEHLSLVGRATLSSTMTAPARASSGSMRGGVAAATLRSHRIAFEGGTVARWNAPFSAAWSRNEPMLDLRDGGRRRLGRRVVRLAALGDGPHHGVRGRGEFARDARRDLFEGERSKFLQSEVGPRPQPPSSQPSYGGPPSLDLPRAMRSVSRTGSCSVSRRRAAARLGRKFLRELPPDAESPSRR